MRAPNRTTLSRAVFGVLACALAATGCRQPDGGLWSTHLSSRRKADAREHWDAIRGGVKLQLARKSLEAGRLDEAGRLIEAAVSMAPKEPEALLLLARLRLEQGRLAEARQAIAAATGLHSPDPEVPYWAGVVHERYGERERALQCYTAASEASPNHAAYLQARVEALVALDRLGDALALVQARLDDFDSNIPLRLIAARVCRELGLRGPAAEFARQAAGIDGSDSAIAAGAGTILSWAGRYDEAIRVLEPVVSRPAPADRAGRPETAPGTEVLHALATAWLEVGRNADVLRLLAPVVDGPASDIISAALYARAAIAQDNASAAEAALEAAHRGHSPTPETLLLSAWLALRRNNAGAALRLADEALRLDQASIQACCMKGQASEAVGRIREARDCYQRAIDLDPRAELPRTLLATLPEDVAEVPPAGGGRPRPNPESEPLGGHKHEETAGP
jgi:tetratricopeptide (TPR) repeat protein